jgi:hypothetical protein
MRLIGSSAHRLIGSSAHRLVRTELNFPFFATPESHSGVFISPSSGSFHPADPFPLQPKPLFRSEWAFPVQPEAPGGTEAPFPPQPERPFRSEDPFPLSGKRVFRTIDALKQAKNHYSATKPTFPRKTTKFHHGGH